MSTGAADALAHTFRVETLKAGTWPTMFVCLSLGIYVAVTPDEPHRPLLGGLGVAALVASVVVLRVPLESIVRGRWCEPFFVSWSATLITLVALGCWADGGVGTPLESLFFLPLIFAALSYPLKSMLLVGAVNVGAYLLIAVLSTNASGAHVFTFTSSLTAAAWVCAWQSRNHDRHRRRLDLVSRTDPLTGCLNRRGFQESCERLLAHGRRTGEHVTLLIVDLDDFKAVNDSRGHAAGDEVLRWVGARLHAEVRAGDVVARLGGDEFAFLMPGADSAEVAARVTAVLEPRAPASVGAAVFPDDGADIDALSRSADAALYEHKRDGGRRSPRRATERHAA
jgi:diguanylate cyclase (GGDEF)-like protein